MRLLFVMPVSSPWARNFVSHIIKLGHVVFIVDLSPIRQKTYLSNLDSFQSKQIAEFIESVSGFQKTNIRIKSIWWIISMIFLLRKAARKYYPDVIVTLYGGSWGFVSWVSRVKPWLLYVVGSDILYGNRIKKFLTKQILKGSFQVLSNGMHLKEKAHQISPKAKIKNLYLGLDTQKFSLNQLKAKNPVIVLCTRGFKKIYNNKYIIDGLREVEPEILQKIQVVFTSTGPQLQEIKDYAVASLPSYALRNIKFLEGVTEVSLLKYLQEAHIYLSLSFSDGASISLMEALACEVFPILSDIPANREWISQENGILVPLDNPKALAAAIARAYANEEWRLTAGIFNRKLITERANYQKNTDYFIGIIQERLNHIRGISIIDNNSIPGI